MDSKTIIECLELSENQIDLENNLWFSVDHYSFGLPHVIDSFDDDDLRYLTETYKIFLPNLSSQDIPRLHDKYASVTFAGQTYGSEFSRLSRSSYVLGKWVARFNGDVDIQTEGDSRPCIIRYFAKQSICFGGRTSPFCFARVSWFQRHPDQHLGGRSGVAPEIWCGSVYENIGPASFLPIQRISG